MSDLYQPKQTSEELNAMRRTADDLPATFGGFIPHHDEAPARLMDNGDSLRRPAESVGEKCPQCGIIHAPTICCPAPRWADVILRLEMENARLTAELLDARATIDDYLTALDVTATERDAAKAALALACELLKSVTEKTPNDNHLPLSIWMSRLAERCKAVESNISNFLSEPTAQAAGSKWQAMQAVCKAAGVYVDDDEDDTGGDYIVLADAVDAMRALEGGK